MPTTFDLVIFDCDGVLVDSETISTRTLIEALGVHGLEVDLDYVRKTYLGRAMSVVKDDYRRLVGTELAGTFENDFLARLFSGYREDLAAMTGIENLLDNLRMPYCMATSSSRERATFSLEVTSLLQYFEGRIFCASMVERGKPAPDLFLLAAKTLGAAPARSLVIEDSEVGVLAAQNAGMPVWRFVGGSHFKDRDDIALDEKAGVPVFDSMSAVAGALAATGAGSAVDRKS